MIKAEVIADSLGQNGDRLTTMVVTMPRYILAEFNTHRMFSKNSASSRAIPFKKMVQSVMDNPFIPIAWQKEHKGMQGTEYIVDESTLKYIKKQWLLARSVAVDTASRINSNDTTKQLCNRLLEPFMYHTVIVSSTEWENFWELRCPNYQVTFPPIRAIKSFRSKKDLMAAALNNSIPVPFDEWSEIDWLKLNKGMADIHMMATAEAMWDAMNESIPKKMQPGDWHIPFSNRINENEVLKLENIVPEISKELKNYIEAQKIRIATAMCARVSYTVVGEEKEINYQNLIDLHDRMAKQRPFHASPFEHIARCMSHDEYYSNIRGEVNPGFDMPEAAMGWSRNFKGFIQYRAIVEQAI